MGVLRLVGKPIVGTLKIIFLVAVAVAFSGRAGAVQLIVGGDFESPVITGTGASAFLANVTPTGWTGTGTLVTQGFGISASSGNGNQWFAIDPISIGIHQSINITAGTTYNFSFLYNGAGPVSLITYFIPDILIGTVSTDSLNVFGTPNTNGSPWATFSTSFTPSTSGDVLLFLLPGGGQGGGGSFIDAVSMTTASVPDVPLPAALPLFATGLGVLGLLGWRRKKKTAVAA